LADFRHAPALFPAFSALPWRISATHVTIETARHELAQLTSEDERVQALQQEHGRAAALEARRS
jgi:hypothetical protein